MSFNERAKWLDESLRSIEKLHESWADRLTLDNLRLGERYAKGDLWIYAQGACFDAPEFGAIFYRAPDGIESHRKTLWLPKPFGLHEHDADAYLSQNGTGYQEEFVFVGVVETIQGPERAVPSLVRLGRPDQFHRLLSESVCYSWQVGFEVFGALGDGVTDSSFGPAALGEVQLPQQVVQCGSEIMHAVSDDPAPFDRGLRSHPCARYVVSGLRLLLGERFIRFVVKEPAGGRMKITDVVFGPFDLQIDADE